MKYFISGELNHELLAKFVTEFDGAGTIYLSSEGGLHSVQSTLQDLIDNSDAELVGIDRLGSCAANLFLLAKCQKRLLPSFEYMTLHLLTADLNSRDLLDSTKTHGKIMKTLCRQSNKALLNDYATIGISDEMLQELAFGRDVFLTRKDIEKLLIWYV